MDREGSAQGLYLLLSVDVAGSTAFKNQYSKDKATEKWMAFFSDFYQYFDDMFQQSLNKKGLKARLLKTLGDELIFSHKLKLSEDITFILDIFIKIINKFRKEIHANSFPLELKGNAWVCGVPLLNLPITKANNKTKELEVIDFIGPQMDTGFRISKYSSVEKFTLSADLAYILAKLKDEDCFDKDIHYLGKKELKGVNNGKPYPIFFLYTPNDEISAFDKAINHKDKNIDPAELIKYFDEYIYKTSDSFQPFIINDKENIINRPPDKYQDQIRQMQDEIEKYRAESTFKELLYATNKKLSTNKSDIIKKLLQ